MKSLLEEVRSSSHSQAKSIGRILAARNGSLLRTRLERAGIGDLCTVYRDDEEPIPAQVIAFEESGVKLAPFDSVQGISPGNQVVLEGRPPEVTLPISNETLVLDCLGTPLETKGKRDSEPSLHKVELPLENTPPSPLLRAPIEKQLYTGINAIDLCTPLGRGQRIGLFAGAGLGKSTLLTMIAERTDADRVVIALVGERGREVAEFISAIKSRSGGPQVIIVVATSDESPVRRRCATYSATSIAEFYRSQGEDVLLLVDSLTRTARSIRDLGISAGELPVRQGYTSSVFDELPHLIERTGNDEKGSITAVYTVLTTFNGEMDILAEEIRSLLDGHIILDKKLAQRGIWPAVNIPQSISRLATQLGDAEHLALGSSVRRILSRLENDKDVAMLGGTPDEELKRYLALEPHIEKLVTQSTNSKRSFGEFVTELREILSLKDTH